MNLYFRSSFPNWRSIQNCSTLPTSTIVTPSDYFSPLFFLLSQPGASWEMLPTSGASAAISTSPRNLTMAMGTPMGSPMVRVIKTRIKRVKSISHLRNRADWGTWTTWRLRRNSGRWRSCTTRALLAAEVEAPAAEVVLLQPPRSTYPWRATRPNSAATWSIVRRTNARK